MAGQRARRILWVGIALCLPAVLGLVVWFIELQGFRNAQRKLWAENLERDWCTSRGDLWDRNAKLCRGLADGEIRRTPRGTLE
ncbi:MAG: hypothetical protein AAF675_06875 [Pseudomonadota bacterium]